MLDGYQTARRQDTEILQSDSHVQLKSKQLKEEQLHENEQENTA